MNVEIDQLNSVASGDLPRDRPVAIVTASYEGQVSDYVSAGSDESSS
jgi:hypothetical protein